MSIAGGFLSLWHDPPAIIPCPASADSVPSIARTLLWLEIGGVGRPELVVLNPYTHFTAPSGPAMRLAVSAGRSLLRSEAPPSPWTSRQWQLVYFSSVVWTSRHWSVDEALATVLSRAYYGHEFYGFDSAAKGYFGLHSSTLTPFEIAQLVVLAKNASRYDPWCRQSANMERATGLVAPFTSDHTTRIRSAPVHACSYGMSCNKSRKLFVLEKCDEGTSYSVHAVQ